MVFLLSSAAVQSTSVGIGSQLCGVLRFGLPGQLYCSTYTPVQFGLAGQLTCSRLHSVWFGLVSSLAVSSISVVRCGQFGFPSQPYTPVQLVWLVCFIALRSNAVCIGLIAVLL